MPIYTIDQAPGKGLSTGTINKDSGWGSRTAGGQVIAGHDGEQGINRTNGIRRTNTNGLDTGNNPVVSARAVGSITATAFTVTYTTALGQPLGSLTYRRADGQGAATTVNETGSPPLTSHSIPVTGLTAGVIYTYRVTQTSTAGGGVTQWDGRVTSGSALFLADAQAQTQSEAPVAPPPPPPPDAFAVSALTAEATGPGEVTVSWRTSVYTDGTVTVQPEGGAPQAQEEIGVKRMNHQVILDALVPGTRYAITVTSSDAAGDTVSAGPVAVTAT